MRITKFFHFLYEAERFQNRLYGKYNTVRLISSPTFSEGGDYVWYVSKS